MRLLVTERELLRDCSAERHAEHVGAGMAERVEQVRGLASEAVHPQRDQPRQASRRSPRRRRRSSGCRVR